MEQHFRVRYEAPAGVGGLKEDNTKHLWKMEFCLLFFWRGGVCSETFPRRPASWLCSDGLCTRWDSVLAGRAALPSYSETDSVGKHPQLNCWWRLNTRSSKYAGTYPQVCLLNRIDQINPKLSVNSWDIIPYYFETLTKFAPKWTLVPGLFPLLKYSAPNVSWGSVADALDLRNQTLSTSVRVAKEVTSLEP